MPSPRLTAKRRKLLEKNIIKYSWYKIFSKRLYLPLIAILLVTVGDVSVEQLAFIGIMASITALALQLPTGYFADRYGNRLAIITGSSIASISPLFYLFLPNFWGGLFGAVVFFIGYVFQSGAIEAFMHDTLVELKREKEYSKIMGHAQSYGLLGNAVLMALIPATYAIDHRLPFFLGFISLLALVYLAIKFTYPVDRENGVVRTSIGAFTRVVNTKNISLFLFAGFVGGVAHKANDFRELLYQDLGVAVALFGLFLSIGSLLGALLGRKLHVFDRLSPLAYYFVDLMILTGCLAVAGLARSAVIAVTAFILFTAYSRVRGIVFQAKLLQTVRHVYKATLLSTMNLFTDVGGIIVIAVLGKTLGLYGYSQGYFMFAVIAFAVGCVLWMIMAFVYRRRGENMV